MRASLDPEVIDEPAGRRHRLGSHSGAAGLHGVDGYFRNEFLKCRHELLTAPRASNLTCGSAPVARGESPKRRRGQGLPDIPEGERTLAIALSAPGQDCVRASLDSPIDHARQVNPEKREARIRNRIDKAADKISILRLKAIVLATKRQNARCRANPGEPGYAVAMEASAIDQSTSENLSALSTDRQAVRTSRDLGNAKRAEQGHVLIAQRPGERPSDLGVVDDPSLWHPQPRDAGHVRFVSAKRTFPLELYDPFETVFSAATSEFGQRGALTVVAGHDELSTPLVRNVFVFEEGFQALPARDTVLGLLGTGSIVETGMNHARIVTGLVCGEFSLRLDQRDAMRWVATPIGVGGRQANDSPAHHRQIIGATQGSLPPDLMHVETRIGLTPVKLMPDRLFRDRQLEKLGKCCAPASVAKDVAHVHLVVLEQA